MAAPPPSSHTMSEGVAPDASFHFPPPPTPRRTATNPDPRTHEVV
jgi:hypothetical protein